MIQEAVCRHRALNAAAISVTCLDAMKSALEKRRGATRDIERHLIVDAAVSNTAGAVHQKAVKGVTDAAANGAEKMNAAAIIIDARRQRSARCDQRPKFVCC